MSMERAGRFSNMVVRRPLLAKQVKIDDQFWSPRVQQVKDVMVPYQWEVLNDRIAGAAPSHAVENFRIAAGEKEGPFQGWVFQDSDVAKWLEAASYCLANEPDPDLDDLVDVVVHLVTKAQQEDGYLDTRFTIKESEKRWTNLRDNHEMYCAGHMIEAAVAHYEATGKRTLLDTICRLADHIDAKFGPQPGKKRGYPGHEEIELALVKLYRVTGEDRYLQLSRFFIDERGRIPHYYNIEAQTRGDNQPEGQYVKTYSQAHVPVREQDVAVGHAVRAMYLYSGMADIAIETGDEALAKACRHIWTNLTTRQMYITGGIGSSVHGEAFTFDYDLPNDTAYTETCAAIGLVFWAHRMLLLDSDRKYADVMERALYNGVLSGISLGGREYFYVNPLEVWPEACEKRHDHGHVDVVRQPWFDCACCPPNIARLLASIGQYIYSHDEEALYVHLFVGSAVRCELKGRRVSLTQETGYPWTGQVSLVVGCEDASPFTVAIRIPGWSRGATLAVNGVAIDAAASPDADGYARIEQSWRDGDRIELGLPMPIQRVRAHAAVREDAGKIALMRGPVVYCLEEVDNGPNLSRLCLPRDGALGLEEPDEALGGVCAIRGVARRRRSSTEQADALYNAANLEEDEVPIRAVPYFAWGNRRPGEMIVWIRETMRPEAAGPGR